jgi:hypothetical protein
MDSSQAHLLVSVFMSSEGLKDQRYKIAELEPETDSYFRLGRLVTGLHSLKGYAWKSVVIYFETDEVWSAIKPEIATAMKSIFPNAEIHDHRLDSRETWSRASEVYCDGDVIYLHANDDHALIDQDSSELKRLIGIMSLDPSAMLGAVTHFPEMVGLLSRVRRSRLKSLGVRRFTVGHAVGTTLVRADFFKSWWVAGKFTDSDVVVRPDNPLGKSVSFQNAQILVPAVEVIRHMDGYSHIGLHRPLGPLRNLVKFDPQLPPPHLLVDGDTWRESLWPTKINGLAGYGADIHRVSVKPSDAGLARIRIGVARLQANWGLRIRLRDASRILREPETIGSAFFFPLTLMLALLTPAVSRNILDWFLDNPVRALMLIVQRTSGRDLKFLQDVSYLGTSRVAVRELKKWNGRIQFSSQRKGHKSA